MKGPRGYNLAPGESKDANVAEAWLRLTAPAKPRPRYLCEGMKFPKRKRRTPA